MFYIMSLIEFVEQPDNLLVVILLKVKLRIHNEKK